MQNIVGLNVTLPIIINKRLHLAHFREEVGFLCYETQNRKVESAKEGRQDYETVRVCKG